MRRRGRELVMFLEGQIFGSWLDARAVQARRAWRATLGMTKYVNHHIHLEVVIRRVAWIRLYLSASISEPVVIIAVAH